MMHGGRLRFAGYAGGATAPIHFARDGGRFVTLGFIDSLWRVLDRTDNLGDALGAALLTGETFGRDNVATLTVHRGTPEGWVRGFIPEPSAADSRQPSVDGKRPETDAQA